MKELNTIDFMLNVGIPTKNKGVLSKMKSNPKNRNGIKSRNIIKKVFVELLKDKDASKITVTEIVEKADINRSTFYAHYYDVLDIVEEIQSDVVCEMKKIVNDFNAVDFCKNPNTVFEKITDYLNRNKELFEVCINHQDTIPFLNNLVDIFTQNILNNPSVKQIQESKEEKITRISFVAGGIVLTYIKWFKGTIKCSLEELASFFTKQLSYIVNQ